jgi:hypothetical protein
MATEPVGRPEGSQDGNMSQTPAPKPPSSLEASVALDKFFEELGTFKKLVEKSNESLEKLKEVQDKEVAAKIKSQKVANDAEKSLKELDKSVKKYKDTQGNWQKGTEALQEKYQEDLNGIMASMEEADAAHKEAANEVNSLKKTIEEEKDQRMGSILSIRDLRNTVREFDSEFAATMGKDHMDAIKLATEANENSAKVQKEVSEKAAGDVEKATNEMADGLRKANLEEAAQKAAVAFENAKQIADMDSQEAANALVLAMKPMHGLGEIVDAMKSIRDDEEKRFKLQNPEATDDDLAKYMSEFMSGENMGKEIAEVLSKNSSTEKTKISEKFIAELMEKKKVSRDAAERMISKDPEWKKAIAKEENRHKEVLKSLNAIPATQRLAIAQADKQAILDRETKAEEQNDVPKWAQMLIDTYQEGFSKFQDMFGDMFKKEDGWFKTILLILAVGVGAVLGYIWTKIMFIASILKGVIGLLTHLPFGIGKAIGSMFGGVGGFFGKIFGSLGGVGSKLGSFGAGLAKIFPFFGQLSKAFQFGFRILGKVFFYVGLVIDAIMGAYKGFKQLGNIKGLIMGALAQIISGLTFGLLDFQSIFDFFNTTMGDVFDGIAGVFEPIIEFFSKVYTNFVNAFSRMFAIFQGEGSIFSKILKAIMVGITLMLKNIIAMIVMAIKVVFNAVIVLPFKISKFINEMVFKLIELTYNAFVSLWNWISSGEILADVANFGTWLYEELVGFFVEIINSIADGLGELPVVGGYIKEALGGGSAAQSAVGNNLADAVKETAKTVDEAKKAVDSVAQSTTAPKTTAIAATPSQTPEFASGLKGNAASASMSNTATYSANSVNTAATTASNAQYQATTSTGTVAINAPTTNVASGGGGESVMLSPSNNRNTEPTFRSLLFLEAPAM